jgi:tetratricopeptide (TPR) repeat protein
MQRLLGLIVIVLAFTSCAHPLRSNRNPSDDAVLVPGVPVREFGADQCGPGSLATLLEFHGLPVTLSAVAEELSTTPSGEVLSIDLMLEARRYGLDANWRRGDSGQLAQLVREGRPVILTLRILNVPGERRDLYHFAVVDGHDPERNLFHVLIGDGKARWIPAGRVGAAWSGAGHAMLVTDKLSESELTPDALFHRALALERSGQAELAIEHYDRVLRAQPERLAAHVNRGNALRTLGGLEEAERAYARALQIAPRDFSALNNLAWLLLEKGTDLGRAERLARQAAAITSPEQVYALDTLGRILLARGKCLDAQLVYDEALGLSDTPESLRSDLAAGLQRALLCQQTDDPGAG